jgi:hypothetical protein
LNFHFLLACHVWFLQTWPHFDKKKYLSFKPDLSDIGAFSNSLKIILSLRTKQFIVYCSWGSISTS